jgi:hypothetical protein
MARRHQTGPAGDYSRSLTPTRPRSGAVARRSDPLNQVRERVAELVPRPQAELDAEQAERERRIEQNAGMAKAARGGVFVPGGEW